MIKMYLSGINIFNNKIDFYKSYLRLSKERMQRVRKIKSYRAKCLCIVSELLLKEALENISIKDRIQYIYNEYKKPYIKNHPEIFFNYSHSNEYAICVISDSEIGCDIEYVSNLNVKLYKRFFNEDEINYLDNLIEEEKVSCFFKLWTLKESYIKYIGKGLSCPMDSFNVLVPDSLDCKFIDININSNYKCSICSKNDEMVEIYRLVREDLLK